MDLQNKMQKYYPEQVHECVYETLKSGSTHWTRRTWVVSFRLFQTRYSFYM